MTETSQEERQAIRDSFQRLLAEHSGEAQVRRSMASESGYDPLLWEHLSETGFLGALIPSEYGGIGGGPVELELLNSLLVTHLPNLIDAFENIWPVAPGETLAFLPADETVGTLVARIPIRDWPHLAALGGIVDSALAQ